MLCSLWLGAGTRPEPSRRGIARKVPGYDYEIADTYDRDSFALLRVQSSVTCSDNFPSDPLLFSRAAPVAKAQEKEELKGRRKCRKKYLGPFAKVFSRIVSILSNCTQSNTVAMLGVATHMMTCRSWAPVSTLCTSFETSVRQLDWITANPSVASVFHVAPQQSGGPLSARWPTDPPPRNFRPETMPAPKTHHTPGPTCPGFGSWLQRDGGSGYKGALGFRAVLVQ
jgi:hypothetical protein